MHQQQPAMHHSYSRSTIWLIFHEISSYFSLAIRACHTQEATVTRAARQPNGKII